MTKILSGRHGDVKRDRKKGDFTWELTQEGVKEAQQMGEFANDYYKHNPPTGLKEKVRLCCSPAYRSTFTAMYILATAPDIPFDRRANGAPLFQINNLMEINFGVIAGLEKKDVDQLKAAFKTKLNHFKRALTHITDKSVKSQKEKKLIKTVIKDFEIVHPIETMLQNFDILKDEVGGNFFAVRPGGNSPMDVYGQACEFMDYVYRAIRDDGCEDFMTVSHGGTAKAIILAATGENALLYDKKIANLNTGCFELIKTEPGGKKMQYYGPILDMHENKNIWKVKDPEKPIIYTLTDSYPDLAKHFSSNTLKDLQERFPDWKIGKKPL
jgi:broad specificity phosphatase PhoE